MRQNIPNQLTAFELLFQFHGSARLTVDQVSKILNRSTQAVRNDISIGTFGIPSHLDQRRRYFDIRDVATYLDQLKEESTEPKKGRSTKGDHHG
jgi:hypothetical protein